MCGCECVPAPRNGFGYLTIPSGGSCRIMWCCDAFWWIFDWLWWVIVGSDRVYMEFSTFQEFCVAFTRVTVYYGGLWRDFKG